MHLYPLDFPYVCCWCSGFSVAILLDWRVVGFSHCFSPVKWVVWQQQQRMESSSVQNPSKSFVIPFNWLVNRDCHDGQFLSLLNRVAYNPSIQLVNKDLGHCFKYCQLEVPLLETWASLSLPETTPFKVGDSWDSPDLRQPYIISLRSLLYVNMSTIHGHLGMWNPASSSSSSATWASSSSSASQQQCNRCLPSFHRIHGIHGIHGKILVNVNPVLHDVSCFNRPFQGPCKSPTIRQRFSPCPPDNTKARLRIPSPGSTQAGANNLEKLDFNHERNNNKDSILTDLKH